LIDIVPASATPFYLAVWVADDVADGDGDPLNDANGILALRAVALGPGGIRAVTAVSIGKTALPAAPEQVRILTIRPQP
jgi:hypothetical protein